MKKDNDGINSIKLCIYFHTKRGGFQLPQKTAFKRGAIAMPTNHRKGIRASDSKTVYFGKSQKSLIQAIKECLKNYGIKLVEEGKEEKLKKYLQTEKNPDFFDEQFNV